MCSMYATGSSYEKLLMMIFFGLVIVVSLFMATSLWLGLPAPVKHARFEIRVFHPDILEIILLAIDDRLCRKKAGLDAMVLVIVKITPVTTNTIQVLEVLEVILEHVEARLVRQVPHGISLGNAHYPTLQEFLRLHESKPFKLLNGLLDELIVVHDPHLVALEHEIFDE